MTNGIDYFYPELNDPAESNRKKKYAEGLLSLKEASEAIRNQQNIQKQKKDLVERADSNSTYLTDDGRQLLI